MPPRRSLRARVAFGFAALGATLSLMFGVGMWLAAQDVSRRLMDQTLTAEIEDYMARRARNPASLPPAGASLRGYFQDQSADSNDMPPILRDLAPGQHEVVIEGKPFRAAVAVAGTGRYVILFDEARQKRREQRFLGYLIAGVVLVTLFSATGGWWLAGKAIAPVTELAHAVAEARPEEALRLDAFRNANAPGDEIDELARAFDRYLARLGAFIERERDFAADASHELRTPLAVIRGASEVIAGDPTLNPATRARLARIQRASEEMTDLIDALLLLAREADPTDRASCRASLIAGECVERYREQANGKGIRLGLIADGDVELDVPAPFFGIVLANLVRNALAHTRDGEVRIVISRQSMVVSDTGSGIVAVDQGLIFGRLYRGNESQGHGIGLFLVKRICDRLGWAISVDSDATTGTAVTLSFPRT